MRRLLALVMVCALALTGCASTAASGPIPVVGLTYIPNIQFSPFYVADQKGLFGRPVKLRHHGASEGLFTALVTGDEQFVVAGGDELLQARAEGVDLVAVASYYRRYPVRIIVPADSTVTTPAQLKGLRIGLPGKYGENWFGLKVALAEAGLTEADVTIVEIGYTQQAALATKRVDAVIGFVNGDEVALDVGALAAPLEIVDPPSSRRSRRAPSPGWRPWPPTSPVPWRPRRPTCRGCRTRRPRRRRPRCWQPPPSSSVPRTVRSPAPSTSRSGSACPTAWSRPAS